jgi:Leucine-rich repeat (LRR) protein
MSQTTARTLNLWKRGLGQVPDSVWDQAELETLVLADNGLTEVSERIGRLKQLRMLDLGHNQLRSLEKPTWLASLEGRGCAVYL